MVPSYIFSLTIACMSEGISGEDIAVRFTSVFISDPFLARKCHVNSCELPANAADIFSSAIFREGLPPSWNSGEISQMLLPKNSSFCPPHHFFPRMISSPDLVCF